MFLDVKVSLNRAEAVLANVYQQDPITALLQSLNFSLCLEKTLSKYVNCVFKIRTASVTQARGESQHRVAHVPSEQLLTQGLAIIHEDRNEMFVDLAKITLLLDVHLLAWLIEFLKYLIKPGGGSVAIQLVQFEQLM